MFDLMDNLIGSGNQQDANSDMPTTLFVTDADGNILLSNTFTALTIGISLEELLRCNVKDLVKAGAYDNSATLEAIRTKRKVTKVINTNKGFSIRSCSTPILYSDGTVHLIVTMSDESQPESFKTWRGHHLSTNEEMTLLDEFTLNEQSTSIIAESLEMKRILRICHQVAPFDSKVLLYGESGTGKEVLARYLHEKSERQNGQFISINCAAIPANLFESELFGHEKGAFTGAEFEKPGMLELANHGTLFLDEISEMPLELQAKLLRVLESGESRRIGATKETKLNFRLVCATNLDLNEQVEQGKFRRDLYYRINVVPVYIPPLRERPLDIIALAKSFIQQFNEKYHKNYQLNGEETKKLIAHSWPGNVRELRNRIERLVVMADNGTKEEISTGDFALDLYTEQKGYEQDLKTYLAEVERHYISKILSYNDNNVSKTADQLGIHRSVLYRKLKDVKDFGQQ
ncbi:sigma-54 interaction domain-containing protein [Listeria ilorinensis]|uniref:sigma-54 interaction domain-containing protein n=1 Tax=Listeria ilorinensis TaxID=2867439 RepID=UPI001EF6E615|nr:sigma 54-interacting transcriptional regulator [Listeria ilorinensis]